MSRALSGERVVDLLQSLADILDDYVAFGVREDFQPGWVGAADPTYADYFTNRIDAASGVAAFLARYPLLQNAIATRRQYFVWLVASRRAWPARFPGHFCVNRAAG